MIERSIRVLIAQRFWVCVALLVSLSLAALGATRIRFRFQYADFYDHPKNADMPVLRRYLHEFGDGRGILLLVEAPDVFSEDCLRYVAALSGSLAPNPLFTRVRSLTNVNSVRASPDGVRSGPLVAHLPLSASERAAVAKTALDSNLLVHRLVSADAKLTALLVELRTRAPAASVAEQAAAISAVNAVLARVAKPQSITASVSGAPVVEVETTRSLMRDQSVLTPVVLLLLAAALFATFGSGQGVLLPLAAVGTSVLWTLGVFGALIGTADLTASVIPTTLLVYGVVDPVFVLARYYGHIDAGLQRDDAIVTAVSQLLLPCFLTSLSTALGFAAFATASLPTIQHFGLIVGLGILLSFVTTLTVLPVLLTLVPTPQRGLASRRSARWVDGALRSIFRHTQAQRALVIAGTLALIGLGGLAFARTHDNNVYVGLLPDGAAARSVRLVDRQLSGVMTHAVYLEGPAGSMARPEVLRAIDAVDQFAERDPMVGSATSLADVVADAHRAFNDDAADTPRLPRSTSLITQYLSLLEPRDRADFVSDDYAQSHILIRARDPGSRAGIAFLNELARRVHAEHFERFGIRASVTGNGTAYRELDRLVDEVVLGFVFAFAIIVGLQWLLFRSARIAVASVVPNLVPVAVAFLTMRALGLSLRMDNSLVLGVCVGGLFNTTIHLVARMLQLMRGGVRDPDSIVEQALRTVGPPALYTAAVLSLGFSALLLSDFPGLREFGILSAVTLISGFFADAIVTSVIMRWLVAVSGSSIAAAATRREPQLQETGNQL
jgi:predicted RND superfamily exporter protein